MTISADARRRRRSSIATDDDVTMFYTSGTTGHPKGAVGTHRNAISNLMNLFFAGARGAMRFGGGDVGRRRARACRTPAC